MDKTYLFPARTLAETARDVLLAARSPLEEAELVSSRLLTANLTGHDSHGIIRLHQYMDMQRAGTLKPGQKAEFLKDSGSTAVLTGHRGYGQTIANEAMKIAIQRAKEHNLAAIGVTDLNHVGRLADYVILAAQQNMVAMMWTATGGFSQLVAPFGAFQRRMSTNPFAAAFPSDRPAPVVLDFATSAYAEGKFRVMRDAGAQMPHNVLLDKNGKPSTDPNDLYAGGAIRPLGGDQGYKGYLLNFLVEVLGGILTGGGYMGKEANPPLNNCSLMVLINVSAYRTLPDFKRELEALIRYLKGAQSAPGDQVLAPGEKEARIEAERREKGIPLAAATVAGLQWELDHFKIPRTLLTLGTESREQAWDFAHRA
jgi:hydroxycarboxylate dehydrogenase B